MLILPIRYAIPHTLSSSSPKIFEYMLLINDDTIIYQLKKKSRKIDAKFTKNVSLITFINVV